MNNKDIEKFGEELRKNNALVQEVGKATEGKSESEALKAVVAIGAKHGYRFTTKDAAALRQAALSGASSELQEEDLKAVAGGRVPPLQHKDRRG